MGRLDRSIREVVIGVVIVVVRLNGLSVMREEQWILKGILYPSSSPCSLLSPKGKFEVSSLFAAEPQRRVGGAARVVAQIVS